MRNEVMEKVEKGHSSPERTGNGTASWKMPTIGQPGTSKAHRRAALIGTKHHGGAKATDAASLPGKPLDKRSDAKSAKAESAVKDSAIQERKAEEREASEKKTEDLLKGTPKAQPPTESPEEKDKAGVKESGQSDSAVAKNPGSKKPDADETSIKKLNHSFDFYRESLPSWSAKADKMTEAVAEAKSKSELEDLESAGAKLSEWITATEGKLASMSESIGALSDEEKKKHLRRRLHRRKTALKALKEKQDLLEERCRNRKERLQEIHEEEERELLREAEITQVECRRMLGLDEMEMDGTTPKQALSLEKLSEAAILLNGLAGKRTSRETPYSEAAQESRAKTDRIIAQIKTDAKEFEKRYHAYLGTDVHAKEAHVLREEGSAQGKKRAEYLAHKRFYQRKNQKRMDKTLADKQSSVMRMIRRYRELSELKPGSTLGRAARSRARAQDVADEKDERFENRKEWTEEIGGSIISFLQDHSKMREEFGEMRKTNVETPLDAFGPLLTVAQPIVDLISLVHDGKVFIKNFKHMTISERLKGIGALIAKPGFTLAIDGASAVLDLLGYIDSIPIIGPIIGLVKGCVDYAKTLVTYYHALDNHYAMVEKKAFLYRKMEETKRKLGVRGAKAEKGLVLMPDKKRKNWMKQKLMAHAHGLTAAFSGENLSDKQRQWKEERRKGDDTHRTDYYRAKIAQMTRDYVGADDAQVKSNGELADVAVDLTKTTLGLFSMVAKLFPGYGTAVGIGIDVVSFAIGTSYKVGKIAHQKYTDKKHPDSDSATSVKKARASTVAAQLIDDLVYVSNKVNDSGEYIGKEEDRHFVAARMNNLRQMIKHTGLPIYKLVSAQTTDQFQDYIAGAFA